MQSHTEANSGVLRTPLLACDTKAPRMHPKHQREINRAILLYVALPLLAIGVLWRVVAWVMSLF